MNEVGVEIVKTEETEKSGIKYLNINVSNSEVERNPDIVRIRADAGILEYVKSSGDLISRQAVLALAKEECDTAIIPYRKFVKGVNALPPVNPQEPKWIPVSERLPEDEDYVLVCYADGSIRTAYYYIDTEIYPSEFEDCCETGWYNYNEDFMYKQDVIAWMPLPKPYESQESEEV